MTALWAFIVGCFVGCWMAIFVVGMCVVAGRADRGRE